MTKEQIQTLIAMMKHYREVLKKGSQERIEYSAQILAYLAGCVDGIK